MINRLGISIHAREVRAVLVRGRQVAWHAAVDRTSITSLGDAITSLLSSLPKSPGVRRATVAIGPSSCQVKKLDGLPSVGDLSLLTRLLHENSASFFLLGGSRLAITDVARLGGGTLWAGAFDHDVALVAVAALKKKGYLKFRIVPSVIALASVLQAGETCWSDGDHAVEIRVTDGQILAHVRRVLQETPAEIPKLIGPVTQLGDDAWPNAAAFAAAILPRNASFTWRPAPDPKRVARLRRVRMAAMVVVCVLCALAAVVAPGVRAARVVRNSAEEMDRLREAQTEFARAQGELRRTALALDRIERFQAERGKTTLLLGALSQALPESTALATLRLDSLDGNFVALTPHAADILPQLASIPEIISPRIVGSLTNEMVGTAQVQRATIRFKRPARVDRAASNKPSKPESVP